MSEKKLDLSAAKKVTLSNWVGSGSPWVWLNAGGVAICLIMVLGLLAMIASRGLVHFWPAEVMVTDYPGANNTTTKIAAEIRSKEMVDATRLRDAGFQVPENAEEVERLQLKVGNRELYGFDFRFVLSPYTENIHYPENIIVVERMEWGNLYGYLESVSENGNQIATDDAAWQELSKRIQRVTDLRGEAEEIEKAEIGSINYQLEKLRLQERGLELEGYTRAANPEKYTEIDQKKLTLKEEYSVLEQKLADVYIKISRDSAVFKTAEGTTVNLQLKNAVMAYRPNEYSFWQKIKHYGHKVWEFIAHDPREANTEGGIFPAIFGTVTMVLVMSMLVTPFGVVAALYLHEYAKQGVITRTIRVAVNNLAGVPSIVYGVFGLGFFVYFLGGAIDDLFFVEAKPAPTFGTPGLMWASLTLALLTLPVVIVSTEEGLSRIPRAIREGSLALGATKIETLWRVVIPMASPGIMTGLILAVARAAGEVAPLMLVGVVKLAPSLPIDLNAPFLHLDRKFMHLGFHIYDVGFQSPNVEAARPLVYATALLLVILIIVLNLAAVRIRNNLREKFNAMQH